MLYRLLWLGFVLYPFLGLSQWNQIPFQEVCDFIYTDRKGISYISSVNGWYGFAGLKQPKKLEMSGLDNRSIQSNMLQGHNHTLWFSTYNRIIRFDQSSQQMTPYALTTPLGDTLNSDYYVFRIDTIRNKLWVQQANHYYLFDTEKYTSEHLMDSVSGRRVLNCSINGSLTFLSYYYTSAPQIVQSTGNEDAPYIRRAWSNWPAKCMANDMAMIDDHTVLIAGSKGLFIGNIYTGQLTEIISEWGKHGAICLQETNQGTFLVSFEKHGLKWLDWNEYTRTFSYRSFSDNLEDQSIQRIIKDRNGIIFLVAYEKSIFFGNPLKRKFIDFNINNGERFHSSRLTERHIKHLVNSTDISSRGIPFLITPLQEIISPPPYSYSQLSGKDHKPIRILHPESDQVYRYFLDEAGNIFGSFLGKGLFQLHNKTWIAVPYPAEIDKTINSFYGLKSGLCIASINQERLVLWNRFHADSFLVDLSFSGDIYDFLVYPPSGVIYAATDQGVLMIDPVKNNFQLVKTTKDIPCHCVLADEQGNLWFSSSTGIYTYNLQSDLLRQFDVTDGVSTIPYWPRKCTSIANDSLVFFYPGGVTLVSPSRIVPLDQPCVVRFSNFKVNDVLHSNASLLNYDDHFGTTYAFNELEFDIHAVDLSDPMGARLKYMLEGYDRNWKISEEPLTHVRYPHLPPGQFTLRVKGANADGNWNEDERRIYISVEPPFWLTWWFISLSLLTAISLLYWTIRSYYRRKLEKKNQLLREQALIIEKQQAVERERTRIASEMHDDLGSGLTTIRYLSDKALAQVKDAEEAIQIQKIADHSNALVRNMSEIIWAMNARFDNADSLTGYLRRYASEYFEDYNIPLKFKTTDEALEKIPLSGERRRNIFLVFKETLHNTIKYAQAASVDIMISAGDNFKVHITETGAKGFDPDAAKEKGNGLYNSQKRMAAIGGNIRYEKTPEAMHIILSVPLNSTTHEQT